MECLEEGAVESVIEDRAILADGWIYWRAVVLDGLRELVGILENGLVTLAVSKLAWRKLDSVYWV